MDKNIKSRLWVSFGKRCCDAFGSLVLMVVLSPVLLGCALAVVVSMGRPIFFRQTRVGKGEHFFDIIKFRTMRSPKEGESLLFSDSDRVTRVGQFLRRTSLDELPELWNILKGEMSLVGPRPLLPAHLEIFTLEQRRRHQVRPGLTGLAQVSGRQHLTFTQRTALDLLYVEKISLWEDVCILLATINVVLRGSGVETGQEFNDVDDIGLREVLQRKSEEGKK